MSSSDVGLTVADVLDLGFVVDVNAKIDKTDVASVGSLSLENCPPAASEEYSLVVATVVSCPPSVVAASSAFPIHHADSKTLANARATAEDACWKSDLLAAVAPTIVASRISAKLSQSAVAIETTSTEMLEATTLSAGVNSSDLGDQARDFHSAVSNQDAVDLCTTDLLNAKSVGEVVPCATNALMRSKADAIIA